MFPFAWGILAWCTMATAIINMSNTRVHLCGERLEVHGKNEETGREACLREIPLRDLDRLVVSETAHFTSAALAEVLTREIPIQYFSWNGKFLGQFLPAENKHGFSRLLQYRRTLENEFTLQITSKILAAKLYNQRRVLQRLGSSRKELGKDATEPSPAKEEHTEMPLPAASEDQALSRSRGEQVERTLRWLDSIFTNLRSSSSLDELRGYEGTSTARYYQAWAQYLPGAFPFEKRSTRPPQNPVNACISFGATLIYNEMTAYLHAHGLDPALGLLHSTENGRWSLALDLLEPFRPCLVEALALDLFSHKSLNGSHFEARNGGILLNEAGRRKYFSQYERRLERQFMSEHVGHRTTLRQQLENQAQLYKAALEHPESFEPFLMN